ncbi:MAG: sigma-70 family RNA polymerase sigma factor [Planctomycetota bacterium]
MRGAKEAFGFLVLRYSRAVRSVVLTCLGSTADMDDLVQECFLRAYKGLNRIEDPSRFGHYVRRIARNLCIDRIRRRGNDQLSLDEVELEPAEVPPPDEDDRLPKLRRVVGGLPEALREAVLLFYFENLSVREMADHLGISEASVSQRLSRARARLRERFGLESKAS